MDQVFHIFIILITSCNEFILIDHVGHCRRKAFWVAKQVLQLGMGDAFDDWLIEKIQLLRKGSVVASGVKRLEQVSSHSVYPVSWNIT